MYFKENQLIGPWKLIRDLGEGGNGEVWEATREDVASAALKILRKQRQNSEPYKRFTNEISIQQQLGIRPGLLPLIDAYLPENPTNVDRAWLAMPVADSLKQYLGDKPELERVVKMMADVAETLVSLAEQGISHRDIKPGNLYFYEGRATIGDFGLVDYPGKESITEPGRTIGPRNFLAPEMLSYSADVDGRLADVYSLAKTLWVLATGQTFPPPGEQRLDTPQMLLHSWVAHPRAYLLDTLIERATRHDPQSRPSMAEVFNELRAWLEANVILASKIDLTEIAKRIMAATSQTQRLQDKREQQYALSRTALTKLEDGLRIISQQIVQAGLGDGAINGNSTVIDRCGVGTRCDAQRLLSDGRCVVITAPGQHPPVLWSGFGVVLYENEQLCLVAAHILSTQSDHSKSQILWWDARWVSPSSAIEERAISELNAGLANSFLNVMQVYVSATEQLLVAGQEKLNLSIPRKIAWHRVADMRVPRAHFSATVVDGQIYVAGGQNNDGYLKAMETYDPITNRWEPRAHLPTQLVGLALAAADNGKVYMVGGFDPESGYLRSVNEYDPTSDKWSGRSSMPTARAHLALIACKEKLYAIGGSSENNGHAVIHAEVEEYDPLTDTWQSCADMPTKRYNIRGTATHDGKCYIVGGSCGSDSFTLFEEYDPANNSWSKRPDMLVARNGHGMSTDMKGNLYVLGGTTPAGYSYTVEKYNKEENYWAAWNSLEEQRTATHAVVIEDKLFVIGGQNDSGILATMEATELES